MTVAELIKLLREIKRQDAEVEMAASGVDNRNLVTAILITQDESGRAYRTPYVKLSALENPPARDPDKNSILRMLKVEPFKIPRPEISKAEDLTKPVRRKYTKRSKFWNKRGKKK